MKKIIDKVPSEFARLDDINNKSIVGILWADGAKSFVIRVRDTSFVSVGAGLTNFDVSNCWGEPSVKEYILSATNGQRATAFLFESDKELYKWMSE